ncbi:MAG: Snf7 family protein [Promethearchaeota archaeon]
MGFLKDIGKWLSGGKKPKADNIRQAIVKLRVFNKRLMRQTKKLEFSAKQARDKAVKLRKEGDLEGSRFHARNYLQIKNQIRAVDTFRTNLEGLIFKLEQASAVKDIASIFTSIAQSISALKANLSIPQISEMMKNMDMDFEDFAVTQELTTDGMTEMNLDSAVSESEIDNFINEIDAEIQVETGAALPSVADNQRIKELEEELNRLRSQE